MKRFIKAIIIGYAVLWLNDTMKNWFGDREIRNLDELKKLIKDKL